MPYKDPAIARLKAKERYVRTKDDPEAKAKKRAYREANLEQCKAAINKAQLRRRYGITPEDLQAMKDQQKGLCAICAEPTKTLCVDHDHKTGKVRGLLCRTCNAYLSIIETEDWYLSAKNYLLRYSR